MSKIKSGKDHWGTNRVIEVSRHSLHGCVKIVATVGASTKKFVVCAIGPSGQPSLSISRGGRRGGIRGEVKTTGGMTVCTARGDDSKCVKGKSMIVFPGGAGRFKGKFPVLGGLRRKRRK